MIKPFNKKDIDYVGHVRNHNLCMQLCLQYISNIAEESADTQANIDLASQLSKYQQPALGQGYTGSTWVRWFLHTKVPEVLEKETENVSER